MFIRLPTLSCYCEKPFWGDAAIPLFKNEIASGKIALAMTQLCYHNRH